MFELLIFRKNLSSTHQRKSEEEEEDEEEEEEEEEEVEEEEEMERSGSEKSIPSKGNRYTTSSYDHFSSKSREKLLEVAFQRENNLAAHLRDYRLRAENMLRMVRSIFVCSFVFLCSFVFSFFFC